MSDISAKRGIVQDHLLVTPAPEGLADIVESDHLRPGFGRAPVWRAASIADKQFPVNPSRAHGKLSMAFLFTACGLEDFSCCNG